MLSTVTIQYAHFLYIQIKSSDHIFDVSFLNVEMQEDFARKKHAKMNKTAKSKHYQALKTEEG